MPPAQRAPRRGSWGRDRGSASGVGGRHDSSYRGAATAADRACALAISSEDADQVEGPKGRSRGGGRGQEPSVHPRRRRPRRGRNRASKTAELLAASLAEVPRAQDFQPLADHLYAFAESTPRLIESLESVRSAVAPLDEWLLRLPRAEDYEPLAAPLREFARVSPALAESLGSVVRTVAPLPDLVGRLSETAERLRALPSAPSAATGREGALTPALAQAADHMAAARQAIRSALQSLPQDEAYTRFATQLKELATVSPSLMEWLRQVPALSLPLGDAVATLDQAAADLAIGERAARVALAGAPATSKPGP